MAETQQNNSAADRTARIQGAMVNRTKSFLTALTDSTEVIVYSGFPALPTIVRPAAGAPESEQFAYSGALGRQADENALRNSIRDDISRATQANDREGTPATGSSTTIEILKSFSGNPAAKAILDRVVELSGRDPDDIYAASRSAFVITKEAFNGLDPQLQESITERSTPDAFQQADRTVQSAAQNKAAGEVSKAFRDLGTEILNGSYELTALPILKADASAAKAVFNQLITEGKMPAERRPTFEGNNSSWVIAKQDVTAVLSAFRVAQNPGLNLIATNIGEAKKSWSNDPATVEALQRAEARRVEREGGKIPFNPSKIRSDLADRQDVTKYEGGKYVPVIGSDGKTVTREATPAILQTRNRLLNLNNVQYPFPVTYPVVLNDLPKNVTDDEKNAFVARSAKVSEIAKDFNTFVRSSLPTQKNSYYHQEDGKIGPKTQLAADRLLAFALTSLAANNSASYPVQRALANATQASAEIDGVAATLSPEAAKQLKDMMGEDPREDSARIRDDRSITDYVGRHKAASIIIRSLVEAGYSIPGGLDPRTKEGLLDFAKVDLAKLHPFMAKNFKLYTPDYYDRAPVSVTHLDPKAVALALRPAPATKPAATEEATHVAAQDQR